MDVEKQLKEQQLDHAVMMMNKYYELAEHWRQMSIQYRRELEDLKGSKPMAGPAVPGSA